MVERLKILWGETDGVLLTSPYHLRYFTGFRGGEGLALITPKQRWLLVDSRYTHQAEQEAFGFHVIEFGGKQLMGKLRQLFAQCQISTLAFEDGVMHVQEYHQYTAEFPHITWAGKSKALDALRMVKTPEELELMRKAEQIGVEAFTRVLPLLKPGVAEREIALELEYQMHKAGAEGTSFETIVVSGEKSSMPHGKPDGKKLALGDFVTMDFGCVYGGYCSDMTRTVVVGKATEEQRRIYETVRRAQQEGLNCIRAGICGRDADRAARDVIVQAGYGDYFGHSLGHGVGLLIHELPTLSPLSDTILQENMIVTCEPGIYMPGVGGVRIEDMVCVTKDGAENFTHLDKDLLEL